jgi:hypothetical protein
MNWELFWIACSSISTFLAVIVALFIPYHQMYTQKKKKIKLRLDLAHVYEGDIKKDSRLCISFLNQGNRDVTINTLYLKTKDKILMLNPYFNIPPNALPVKVEIDNSATIYHSAEDIVAVAQRLIKEGDVNEKDKIVFVSGDSGGKRYNFVTSRTYQYFAELLIDK